MPDDRKDIPATSAPAGLPARDLAGLKARLGGLRVEEAPALVRQRSRDFHWYSPLRKRAWEATGGDLIVSPADERELHQLLSAAAECGVPVTPRGGGTGLAGASLPLAGGVTLDLSGLNQVIAVQPGRVVAQGGAVIEDIDRAARAQGQELRIHPSTHATASIGGFIAGGTGGLGAITWGRMQDAGNLLRARLMTLEPSPRILDLTGADLAKVVGAAGTTGIITEAELPLGPAYRCVDLFLGFATFEGALAFAEDLAREDSIARKNISVIAAPGAATYFARHHDYISPENHLVLAIVAETGVEAALLHARQAGAEVLLRSDKLTAEEAERLPPGSELTWHHTTLRALRVDPAVTAIEALLTGPDWRAAALSLAGLGDDVIAHVELIRSRGEIAAVALPLVRFSTADRLADIVAAHRTAGAAILDDAAPRAAGALERLSEAQRTLKAEADPAGLLNPPGPGPARGGTHEEPGKTPP